MLVMLGQAVKSDSWEAETGGFLCVPGGALCSPSHIGLHWEFKPSRGYIVRSCLKQSKLLVLDSSYLFFTSQFYKVVNLHDLRASISTQRLVLL